MMKVIIAPTDFSPASVNAVNFAADMALEIQAKLILMHADDFLISKGELPLTSTLNYAKEYAEKSLHKLREQILERTNDKLIIETENIQGKVFTAIELLCNRTNAFTVIMATHQSNAADRMLFQSVTLYTAKHVNCPVIVVPEHASYKTIKNVALACDLKTVYEEPIEILKNFIKEFNAVLHILHVVKPGEDKHFGEMMITRHHLYELKPALHFIQDKYVEEGFISFIEKNQIDILIIMLRKEAIPQKTELKKFVIHPNVPLATIQAQP